MFNVPDATLLLLKEEIERLESLPQWGALSAEAKQAVLTALCFLFLDRGTVE